MKELEADLNCVSIVKKNKQKFTCQCCGGTGIYRGIRRYQEKSHCFACRGKGYFKTSPQHRQKLRQQRQERKDKERAAIAASAEAWKADRPEVFKTLVRMSNFGNNFAESIISQLHQKGWLSEKQEAAAVRIHERRIAKEKEIKNNNPNFNSLAKRFLSAAQHIKYPKLRLQTPKGKNIVLKRAGSQSRTPGWIMMTDGRPFGENIYYGKISPDGVCYCSKSMTDEVLNTLQAVEADPVGEALIQGQRTGVCMCCGRELTNAESIKAGIGPICADRWNI